MRALAACLLLAALPLIASEDPATLVTKLAPSAGWAAPDTPRVATHDTLFDLIDGGAELYHEYGFKRAVSWSLAGPAGGSIQVELYEMVDAPAAYGVWSLMQTGKYTCSELGQGSLRTSYYVAFWSGPYFASVTGARSDAATQAEVDRLAAQLAALLPSDGKLPAWFEQLPSTGAREQKYFRGKIGLSNIVAGPAADLVDGSEGLFAEYPDRQVILYHFATEQEAARQLDAARSKPIVEGGKQAPAITRSGTDLLVTTGTTSGK